MSLEGAIEMPCCGSLESNNVARSVIPFFAHEASTPAMPERSEGKSTCFMPFECVANPQKPIFFGLLNLFQPSNLNISLEKDNRLLFLLLNEFLDIHIIRKNIGLFKIYIPPCWIQYDFK